MEGNTHLSLFINIIKTFTVPILGSHNGAHKVNKSYKTGRTCLVENIIFLSCKEMVLDLLKHLKHLIRGRRSIVLDSTGFPSLRHSHSKNELIKYTPWVLKRQQNLGEKKILQRERLLHWKVWAKELVKHNKFIVLQLEDLPWSDVLNLLIQTDGSEIHKLSRKSPWQK